MKKESLKLQAYNIIKEKIVRCEYTPGMMLSEERLQEDVHASRTPIRDALSRLEQDGLIQIMPKKGIMVSMLSIGEINKIFEVRMLFEPYVLRNYGYLLDDEQLMSFYTRFEAMIVNGDSNHFYEIDDEFHMALMGVLPNHYLFTTYDRIHNQNLRFRVLTGRESIRRLEATHNEHLAIVRACLKKEWDEAALAMEHHLLLSKNATFDLLLRSESAL